MKRVILVAAALGLMLSLLFSGIPGAAQEPEFQLAPPNPDFLKFVEDPPEPFYGEIPPPMDLSHVDRVPLEGLRTRDAFPSRFDWRDGGKVTPVKNQNPCETCWAFAPTATLESSVLMDESVTYDFSEQSVALCVDRSWVYLYDDPNDPCNGGGNAFIAAEVFIRKGAVLESCNSYNGPALNCDGTCVCDSCPPVKMVDGFRVAAWAGSEIDTIKNAIYNKGPAKLSYYHNSSYEYWDATWGAIYDYYPCSGGTNHAVTVVGWDDDVPHPHPSHSGTGAWIIKNSWGTADSWTGGAGVSDGYFYLAYDSSCVQRVIHLQYKDPVPGEQLLYWDEAGWVLNGGYGDSSAWMASIFTSGQDGDLTHVDFWTTDSNAQYELHVLNGPFGSQLGYQTGSCAESGYYSIPLDTPIALTNGQQFTVAVEMTTPGYNSPIPIEYVWPLGGHEPPIQTGVCFLSTDGSSWVDAADYGWNICLRARTGDAGLISYDLPLASGLNLISLPLIPESTSIEEVLAGVEVDWVAAWDAATQTWLYYWPGLPLVSDFAEMTHGVGYWTSVSNPCTLIVSGTVPGLPQDIPLFAGSNLIGLPLMPEPQGIADIVGGCEVGWVAAWDAATQTWLYYWPGLPFVSDFAEVTHGVGYWFGVANPCTLTIDPQAETELKVHFIDVGQGDAILIDFGETEILIDGGRYRSSGVAAYLSNYVDGPLEVMVATHPDADHIGGLIAVLEDFEVQEIWRNGDSHTTDTYDDFEDAIDAEGAEVNIASRGDEVIAGELILIVLSPAALTGNRNENSIVLSLSYGEVDFLFTGDAGEAAEESMLEAGLVSSVEVLKVGHHGSTTASSQPFLAATTPEVAIYMAAGNSHPHEDTIAALTLIGAEIYGTDVYGTITITTAGEEYGIETEQPS